MGAESHWIGLADRGNGEALLSLGEDPDKGISAKPKGTR